MTVTPPPCHFRGFALKSLSLAVLSLSIHSAYAETVGISQKLDLGSFLSNNKGISTANAINGYGDVVVGKATAQLPPNLIDKPIAWHHPQYQGKQALPNGVSVQIGNGTVNANGVVNTISRSGKVAAGSAWFTDSNSALGGNVQAPAIWHGNGTTFQSPIRLPVLPASDPAQTFAAGMMTVVHALSADGAVAGGTAYDVDAGRILPALWTGRNYGALTTLQTLGTPNNATITALNDTGNIIIGNSIHSLDNVNGVVWHGSNAAQIVRLKPLHKNGIGNTEASDISADGQIVVGSPNNDSNIAQPTVWQGMNWSEALGLGMPAGHTGRASSISGDGKVIGGSTYPTTIQALPTEQGVATIWFGEKFKESQQLGTLKKDNTGVSHIQDLNHDGTIAVGFSHTDDNNDSGSPEMRATLWRLSYGSGSNGNNSQPVPPVTPITLPTIPPVATSPTNPTPQPHHHL